MCLGQVLCVGQRLDFGQFLGFGLVLCLGRFFFAFLGISDSLRCEMNFR